LPGGRWEYDVKIDLKEMGCEDMDWIHPVHDMVQWETCGQVNEASGFIRDENFL
jgi:hypothetical protein